MGGGPIKPFMKIFEVSGVWYCLRLALLRRRADTSWYPLTSPDWPVAVDIAPPRTSACGDRVQQSSMPLLLAVFGQSWTQPAILATARASSSKRFTKARAQASERMQVHLDTSSGRSKGGCLERLSLKLDDSTLLCAMEASFHGS